MAGKSTYTEEIADRICELIADSTKGVKFVCAEVGISKSTLFNWLYEHASFLDKYTRAREAQADHLVDEILTISDDISDDDTPFVGKVKVDRHKLMIDSRKWIASKLRPKKYGDKMDLTTAGEKLEAPAPPFNDFQVEQILSALDKKD